MNKPHNIIVEIIITLIAAGVLSLLAFFLAYLVLPVFNLPEEQLHQDVNSFSSAVFGIAIGYRLNDIVRARKKAAK